MGKKIITAVWSQRKGNSFGERITSGRKGVNEKQRAETLDRVEKKREKGEF